MSPELLTRILDAVRDDNGRPHFGPALFEAATFHGSASFDGTTFHGPATFDRATFTKNVSFNEATFTSRAEYIGATFTSGADFGGVTFDADADFLFAIFNGHADFSSATFNGQAVFHGAAFTHGALFAAATFNNLSLFAGATFTRGAEFAGVTFNADAIFHSATLNGNAGFDKAIFNGHADFSWATFTRGAEFGGVTFNADAIFHWATVNGNAEFSKAIFNAHTEFSNITIDGDAEFSWTTFETTEFFGPVITRVLALHRAVFNRRVMIQVSARELDCDETRFEAGTVMRLRNVRANFTRAMFAAPSAIADADQPPTELVAVAEQKLGLGQGGSTLTSLEGVDAADLVVSDIDLSLCRFAGGHHLDKLRLEGDCRFAWPPAWRWTRRQVLVEECDLRAAGPRGAVWPVTPQPCTPLNAKRVAALYRDLRKAQEDSKNEPGAADFYYGEMEMRRADRATAWTERLILFLYWLVSGYGLRMSRALLCLAALLTTASVTLHVVGFAAPQPSLSTCLLYAVESAVSLDPKFAGLPNLTWQGEIVRVAMRLLGPLLLGLALLAVRNRVKR